MLPAFDLRDAGLTAADDHQLRQAHELTARLIPGPTAKLEVVQEVAAQAPGAVQVYSEDGVVSGALALLPLSRLGRADVEGGSFCGLEPRPAEICGRRTLPSAFYAWGAAACTRAGGRAVIAGMALLCERAQAPVYAFASTDAGERSLRDSLGFGGCDQARPRLLVRWPRQRLAA